MSDPKDLVRRLVDEVMNGNRLDVLDELCTPALAPKLRRAFEQFRAAFPDWRQEIVELVAETGTVVARFRCTGTQRGEWQGQLASGRAMNVDEVGFYAVENGRISRAWALEDTWSRLQQLAGREISASELGSLG